MKFTPDNRSLIADPKVEFAFDSVALAVIGNLISAVDHCTQALKDHKPISQADSLLKAIQAEAANDSNKTELMQLGQWVFEGCDPKWQSAAINGDGRAFKHNLPLSLIHHRNGLWVSDCFAEHEIEDIPGVFDISNSLRAIQRQPVNDVDYLSERKDFESSVLSDEDMNDVDAALTLSIEDLERVFIQNLSNLLIQRMHSLERFSAPDQKIGIKDIKTWDLVFDKVAEQFGLIVDGPDEDWGASIVLPSGRLFRGTSVNFHTNSLRGRAMRTITEDELGKCRKAMEAAHVG